LSLSSIKKVVSGQWSVTSKTKNECHRQAFAGH
jgi:hypothetical protein